MRILCHNILIIPPIMLVLAAVYAVLAERFDWAGYFLAGASAAFVLGRIGNPFSVASWSTESRAQTIIRIIVAWLQATAQFGFAFGIGLLPDHSVTSILFETVSALSTSGIGPIASSTTFDHPLSFAVALCSAFGGYMSIITGYLLFRVLCEGAVKVEAPNDKDDGVASWILLDDSAASYLHLDQGKFWRHMPFIYFGGIAVVAIALGGCGLPLIKAIEWAAHAVATAGPLPDSELFFSQANPFSSTSIVLLFGMMFGAVAIPLFVLLRLMPQVVVPSLLLWLVVISACVTITPAVGTDIGWLERFIYGLSSALGGPAMIAVIPLAIVPLLVLVACGAFPAGTGGGVKIVNVGELIAWIREDIEQLSNRHGKYAVQAMEKVRRGAKIVIQRQLLAFLMGCWSMMLIAVTLVVSIDVADVGDAFVYATSGITNSGSIVTAIDGGIEKLTALSDISRIALIVAMLFGRIDWIIPGAVVLALYAVGSRPSKQAK